MTTIAGLVTTFARLRATFEVLFETLGSWASDDPDLDDVTRRELATWAHRHARHARLCAERTPTIPVEPDPFTPLDVPERPDLVWYRSVVEQVRTDVADLAARTDPDLDPATAWTARLIADTLPPRPT